MALRAQELPDAAPAPWVVFELDRLSGPGIALLGLRTSTLIFTVIHSVNLMLITTPPEDLVWASAGAWLL